MVTKAVQSIEALPAEEIDLKVAAPEKTETSKPMSHEERVTALYMLIFALVGLQGRVVFLIQRMEEKARIQASKDLSKSYRSLLPLAIGGGRIGLSIFGAAVAFYPRGGTGDGSQRLQNLPSGVFGLLGGKNVDPKFLDKTLPRTISGLQAGAQAGSEIVGNFSESNRTGYRTTGELAQSRFGTATSRKQKLDGESSETLRTLAQISETEARAKESLAR